ncbi:MAG: type 4a pilus biogenesis protein PilO [Actinomycetota bacterium]
MSKRAPLIVAIVSGVLVLLVLLFVVMPKRSEIGKASQELDQAKSTTEELESEIARLQELKANAPIAERKIQDLKTLIPPTADAPGLFRLLQLAADRAVVDVFSVTVDAPSEATGVEFSSIGLSITVNGDFFALNRYLFRLEHLPRAVKVMNVTMTPLGEYPSLQMVMGAETYTTDTSTGPGSQPGPQNNITGGTGSSLTSPAPEGG